MASRSRLQSLFAALLCTLTLAAPATSAFALISNQGSSFFSMTNDFGGFSDFQPIAYLHVGSADVEVGGFGVYGAAEAPGRLRWVVFEETTPVYLSNPQSVSQQGPRWYDSPGIDWPGR